MYKGTTNTMWITLLFVYSLSTITAANTCSQSFASVCGTPLKVGLNDSDKATILATHNRLRNNVALGKEDRGNPGPQPPASNMQIMTWDEELATTAQDWANQCSFTHNTCGDTSRFAVGQNIYAVIASRLIEFNMTQPLGSWYDEVQYFNKSYITPFKYTEKTSHYTQMVWSDSHMLGCGFIAYKNASSGNVWHTMVCNYGPAGNYEDDPMYNTTGSYCSSCTTCSDVYKGLCSIV